MSHIVAQRLQMQQRLRHGCTRKYDDKLFAAESICAAAAAHALNASGYHFQYLIADIMPVRIVEFFKVIDVQHRDHVVPSQARHMFIQRTARGQARELIAKRHVINILQHGDHQHQCGGGCEGNHRSAMPDADGGNAPRHDGAGQRKINSRA